MKKIFSSCFVCFLGMLMASWQNQAQAEIGKDWHVWGMYEFAQVDNLKIAIARVNDEEKQYIGYDIYADGTSRGDLLGQLRCADAEYLPEDIDMDMLLIYEDYNKDDLTDIGLPLRSGDIMWYVQNKDELETITFFFAEAEEASPERARDWHDWGIYTFKKFEDGMTIAVYPVGKSGQEVGFNIYADLGSERGANLASIRWSDGGYEREFFDLENCLVLQDCNKDGLGDIGIRTRDGDIMWYVQNDSLRFSYTEIQLD